MSKSGNITSFFKPVPKSSQSPLPKARTMASSTPPPPSPSPLPALLFSSSPPALTPTVRDRNTVIRASDDEEDCSSEDEFPSLFSPPKPRVNTLPVQPVRKEANIYTTPKAKRRVLEFHSSPLTINTRHKFDIKALLKHAAHDTAIEESEQRMAALLEPPSPTRGKAAPNGAASSLHDTMLDVLSDAEGSQGEGKRGKVLQAIKRTEATLQRKEWCFFDQGPTTAVEKRSAFPKAEATGAWAFLATERHRSEAFEDGLPFHVQRKMHNLPDEIFEWVLKEAPLVNSMKLQDEYIRLLGACPDQIGRLMDEDLIANLFRDLGASERALATGSQPNNTTKQGTPYPEHGRARLRIVLRILTATAHAMKRQSLTQTMAILLRLGIDNVVRDDHAVATDYQDALLQTVLAVPWRAWNNFCGDVTDSLYSHTQEAAHRWNAVSSIPLLHPKLIELRRRLALVFVFDDPRRAFSRPEETFSMRSIIDRLEQADEFTIDRNNTDYFELLALSEMLSVAIGDGLPPTSGDEASLEAVKQYNADVDDVAYRVKVMWSNIHEKGAAFMSRLEARAQLKDFERKLLHVVRTQPPPKKDVFDTIYTEDDVALPKQQLFMKSYFSKDQPPPKTP